VEMFGNLLLHAHESTFERTVIKDPHSSRAASPWHSKGKHSDRTPETSSTRLTHAIALAPA
jgi:hypothetical protein